MQMYNLLEQSNNFSMTLGCLWNCYRDEVNDFANEIDDNDNMITTNKYFMYKTKIIGRTSNDNSRLNAEVFVH